VSPVLLIEEWQHKLEAFFGSMEVDIMLRRWGGNWGYDLTIKNGGFQRFPPKNMRKS